MWSQWGEYLEKFRLHHPCEYENNKYSEEDFIFNVILSQEVHSLVCFDMTDGFVLMSSAVW